MNKCFVLIGVKHSGKTTTGMQIAKKLSIPFFDIDNIIERENGMSCRDLYKREGLEGFQRAELHACQFFVDAIKNIMEEGKQKGVVAVGGGFCDNKKAVDLLRNIGIFVYLEIPKHIAFKRILDTSKTLGSVPAFLATEGLLTESEMEKKFYTIYEKRSPLYEEIADISIQTENLTPDEICNVIIKNSLP